MKLKKIILIILGAFTINTSLVGMMDVSTVDKFLKMTSDSKKQLITQMNQLRSVFNQLLDAGAMLETQLLQKLAASDALIARTSKQLEVPKVVLSDPLFFLQNMLEKKWAPPAVYKDNLERFVQAHKQLVQDFVSLARQPLFRNIYQKITQDIMNKAGVGTVPALLTSLENLLTAVKNELNTLKSDFRPLARDLSVNIDFKAIAQENPAFAGASKLNFDLVSKQYAYIKQKDPGFDPKGIYKGLIDAMADFDTTLKALDDFEVYLGKVKQLVIQYASQ